MKPDRTYTAKTIAAALGRRTPTGEPAMQETAIPNDRPPAPAPAPAEAIIRAEQIEKYYAQPSQNRIQVISATDL